MGSYAHNQLWSHDPDEDARKRRERDKYKSFRYGITPRETKKTDRKRRNKTVNKRMNPVTMQKIHEVADILRREGPMFQAEVCARVGINTKTFNKAIGDVEHIYLFSEGMVGGRAHIGLFKDRREELDDSKR